MVCFHGHSKCHPCDNQDHPSKLKNVADLWSACGDCGHEGGHWDACCIDLCGPALICAEGWIQPRLEISLSPGNLCRFGQCFPPTHYSFIFSCVLARQIEGTQKLLNKDLAELINKMRLAQQNAVTSLSEDCKRQMLTASHTLAVDAKNLLDAVDQAKVVANLAHPPAE